MPPTRYTCSKLINTSLIRLLNPDAICRGFEADVFLMLICALALTFA